MFRSIILTFSFLAFSNLSLAQIDGGGDSGGTDRGGSQFPDENLGDLNEHMDDVERALNDAKRKNTKARPKFASLFDHAQNAILKDDMKKAGEAVTKLHEIKTINAYEESRLYLIDYWYYGKQGNKELEYGAASKLMEVGAGNVDSHAFVEAGMRLLKRQYNNQDLGGAIDTLANLRKDSASQSELMSVMSVVKKLDDLAEQQTDIVQKITTDETGSWSTKLFRPQFFFNGIAGEISTLAFDCANKQTTLNYKVDSVMEIPEAWGSCTMKVSTKPNTTFNLVQVQKKPA